MKTDPYRVKRFLQGIRQKSNPELEAMMDKKPMNKYLKGALWVMGTIIVIVGALFLICNGVLDTILDIGSDLGIDERLP